MTGDRAPGAPPMGIDEFVRMLPFLEASELLSISASYRGGDAEVRESARAEAGNVAKQRGLVSELDRLHGSIAQWAGADIPTSGAFTLATIGVNPMLWDLRLQCIPPLLDAATALLLGQALRDDIREALAAPLDAVHRRSA